MTRRRLVTLLGAAAAMWPLAASAQQPGAQQPGAPVIGYLSSGLADQSAYLVEAFGRGLKETGFVAGANVMVEYRWAHNQYDRLPALAAELASRPVKVIAAPGGPAVGLAAKAATATIPIVFTVGSDPVRYGLVASLNRPGGNLTGISLLISELAAKRLELLRELAPQAATVGLLLNPANHDAKPEFNDTRLAAQAKGQELVAVEASAPGDFDSAFETLAKQRVGALIVSTDPFFVSQRKRIVALTAQHGLPAIYEFREFVEVGGLVSYGTDRPDAYRQVGVYVGKILNGANPAELPVQQATKYELVVNLQAARALGLRVSTSLLTRADAVIE